MTTCQHCGAKLATPASALAHYFKEALAALHGLRIALHGLGHVDMAAQASNVIFELEDLGEAVKHARR